MNFKRIFLITGMVLGVWSGGAQEKLTFDQDKKIIEHLLTELEKSGKVE